MTNLDHYRTAGSVFASFALTTLLVGIATSIVA
jgi:hypothetical protein